MVVVEVDVSIRQVLVEWVRVMAVVVAVEDVVVMVVLVAQVHKVVMVVGEVVGQMEMDRAVAVELQYRVVMVREVIEEGAAATEIHTLGWEAPLT
jgi:hypothetical protein